VAAPGKPKKAWFVRGTAEEQAVIPWEDRAGRGPSRLVLLLVLLGFLAAIALWLVPVLQVEPARERLALSEVAPADRLALENQLLEAENGARGTLALILAAAGVLLGSAIIWRRFELSRELKTHERFAVAVEQLASERGDGTARTEARLGGIYALERLALESEREYWPVMEVLTAYVRENAAWKQADRAPSPAPPRPAADIQAIMAVLGRRRPSHTTDKRLLDLRETDLRGANLSGSRLDGVTLYGSHLEQADATRAVLTRSNLRDASLLGASLGEVDLEGASLARANLEGARLNGANLRGADLSGANLRSADLWQANLKGCNLKDADLRGADLSQSVLEDAILWRANLADAVLTGARLHETHLERANLSGATGLTWEQGEDAYTDENTVLPEYLAPGAVATRPTTAPVVVPAASASPPPAARRAQPHTPSAEPQPKDNVVQLNAPARQRRSARVKPKTTEPPKPKKAALPKHRKPGLVKPA
jgi:uncharacterized protein YjbI with pentapeptide repeats